MYKTIIALLFISHCLSEELLTLDSQFASFIKEHEKVYESSEEHIKRFEIYKKNMEMIEKHNSNPNKSWSMRMNFFGDLTSEEFKFYRGYNKQIRPQRVQNLRSVKNESLNVQDLPENWDWADKNVITPVKNQKSCGSCWAFGATEAVESAVAINDGVLLELAPQQLVDCVENPKHCGGTGGCEGATFELAFDYLANEAHGFALEKDYEYEARDERCRFQPSMAAATITGYEQIKSNDADAVQQALYSKGPLSIVVSAEPWQFYDRGVFDSCGYKRDVDLDHGVYLSGYGVDEETGKKFWKVRNSWGRNWGEEGYIRVVREDTTKCGIDKTPQDGVACEGDNDPFEVCGCSGLLYDAVFPTGAHAVKNSKNPDLIFIDK